MDNKIVVEDLEKIYRVPVREHGLISSFKSLFRPVYNNTKAVNKISFEIKEGEIVGFIGPNGAGKTTTLKMLSGLLYPTSGYIDVAGFKPYERKEEYLKSISMIMGNKTQLNWDITVMDSLYVIKEIYQVSDKAFKKRLDEMVDLLGVEKLLPKLARNLSLGERVKCEVIAALLYQPRILFLDEPTLGLDTSIQIKLRNFIKEYGKKHNTTMIITSHYLADIESLCSRLLLINDGKLIYDGRLDQLSNKISPYKLIKVTVNNENEGTVYGAKGDGSESLRHKKIFGDILRSIGYDVSLTNKNSINYKMRIKKEDISTVVASLLNNLCLSDLTIEDPPIETVIDQVYREGVIE